LVSSKLEIVNLCPVAPAALQADATLPMIRTTGACHVMASRIDDQLRSKGALR
jgi:hypothetical protein